MNPNMKNEKLRKVFVDLGLQNVQTVISSGNVIFDSNTSDKSKLEERIEAEWPERLGFTSTTIIRTAKQIEQLVASAPFGDRTHGPKSYLLVTFSKHPLEVDVAFPTLIGATRGELFTVTDTEDTSTPNAMKLSEDQFGKEITSRTWLTVLKVHDRMRS